MQIVGNPGMNGSRHSVGMAVLEALAARLRLAESWHGDRHISGEVIVSDIQDTQIVLLRPRLLMNINGVSVAKAGEDSCVFLMSFDVLWIFSFDCQRNYDKSELFLLKMNCSWYCFVLMTLNKAVKCSIKPEHFLLVHDDLDKALGKLAMKQGGSARWVDSQTDISMSNDAIWQQCDLPNFVLILYVVDWQGSQWCAVLCWVSADRCK